MFFFEMIMRYYFVKLLDNGPLQRTCWQAPRANGAQGKPQEAGPPTTWGEIDVDGASLISPSLRLTRVNTQQPFPYASSFKT